MKLESVKSLETAPPQWIYTFKGPDLGGKGDLRLSFNITKLNADLYYTDGLYSEEFFYDSAPCQATEKFVIEK